MPSSTSNINSTVSELAFPRASGDQPHRKNKLAVFAILGLTILR